MTKQEREYLQKEIEVNKSVIKRVESGKLWADIYKTKELRLAFIQGMVLVNDVLDKYVNGNA